MSDRDPLQHLPLSPSTSPPTSPGFPCALNQPQERYASDAKSALGSSPPLLNKPCPSQALAHSLESYASDSQSALGPSPLPVDHLSLSLPYEDRPGSVTSELSGTMSPRACTQIPTIEAEAFATVCRPHTTGNSLLSSGPSANHLLRMSGLAPELQADYFDLRRHTRRSRSASFHATRSPAAVALRAQDSHPLPPGYRGRHSFLERHRHWSVSGTDLHPPDFEAPYRLL